MNTGRICNHGTKAKASALMVAMVAAVILPGNRALPVTASEQCPTLYESSLMRQETLFDVATPFSSAQGGANPPGFDKTAAQMHTPNIAVKHNEITVTVGEEGNYHPQTASPNPLAVHFIEHIVLVDSNDNTIINWKTLDPSKGSPARATFPLVEGVTSYWAVAICNLHGMWVSEVVNVSKDGRSGQMVIEGIQGMPNALSLQKPLTSGTEDCTVGQPKKSSWVSWQAEFDRREGTAPPWNRASFKTEADGPPLHVPQVFTNEDGSKAKCTEGNGWEPTPGGFHPMLGVDDVSNITDIHWIGAMWMTDENDNILGMTFLDPTGINVAQFEVDLPSGTKTVKCRTWCNVHGGYDSNEHSVKGMQQPMQQAVGHSGQPTQTSSNSTMMHSSANEGLQQNASSPSDAKSTSNHSSMGPGTMGGFRGRRAM